MKTTRPGSLPKVGPRKSDHGMPNHSIEDPSVIAKILSDLECRGGSLRVGDSSPKEHARRQRFARQLKEPRAPG